MSEPGVRLSGSCFQLSTKRCWKGLLKPCKGLVLPFLAATSAAYEIRIAVLNGVEKLLPPKIILLQPCQKYKLALKHWLMIRMFLKREMLSHLRSGTQQSCELTNDKYPLGSD
jgi:hypothetical protein